MLRPGASRMIALAAGWRPWRACWRLRLPAVGALGSVAWSSRGGHDAGQFGHDPHGLGECHPLQLHYQVESVAMDAA